MDKKTFIEKYGLEKYQEYLRKNKLWRKGISIKPPKTDYEVRIWRPAPEVEEEGRPRCVISDERCRIMDEIVRQYQKKIRSIWKEYTKDENIIVVYYGKVRGKRVPYTFQLTDLRLTEEKRNKFFDAVNEVIDLDN